MFRSLRIGDHLPAPIVNGEGYRPSKVQFSELQRARDLDLELNLDRVIRHTIVHQSSTSIYTPNFTEIGKTFWWTDERMDKRTYWQTFQTPSNVNGSTRRSWPKNGEICMTTSSDVLTQKIKRACLLCRCGQFYCIFIVSHWVFSLRSDAINFN